jgi:hypothetical protein
VQVEPQARAGPEGPDDRVAGLVGPVERYGQDVVDDQVGLAEHQAAGGQVDRVGGDARLR